MLKTKIKEIMPNFFRKIFFSNSMKKKDRAFHLKEGQKVFLKATNEIPKSLAVDFIKILKNEGSVERAYLAEGFLEEGDPVHYIIGVKFDSNKTQTINNFMVLISKELRGIIPKDLFVDIIEITEQKGSINNFIQNCIIPFYIKES